VRTFRWFLKSVKRLSVGRWPSVTPTELHRPRRTGPGPYARDVVNTMDRWPFAVEDIAVTVTLWYGRLDTSILYSPDFGA
jgi:hypothetical protein